MPEIKMIDLQETKNPSLESFHSIMPEQGTTLSNAREYWNEVFNDSKDTKETSIPERMGNRFYYDDNGVLYRKNDCLEPNSRFEVRGYTYETDELGRTKSAEGKIRIRDPEFKRDMDSMEAVGRGNQIKGDQRGHLIAHQFDGSGGIENLSPMAGELNQRDYAKLENKLADAVKEGADVKLRVEPRYEGDSFRPSEYRVSYSIDGERDIVIFRNGTEE